MSNFSDLNLHEMRNLGYFFPISYSNYFLVNKWCIFGVNMGTKEEFRPYIMPQDLEECVRFGLTDFHLLEGESFCCPSSLHEVLFQL